MSNTDLPPGAVLLPERAAQPSGLPPGAILLEDPYRKAAIEEQARLYPGSQTLSGLVTGKAPAPAGPGVVSDYTRRLTQGLGANWTDEALAALTAPVEAVARGINPIEAYKYTKARENLILEGARERTGTTGSAVEVLGGLATGGRAVLGGLPAAGSAVIRQVPGVAGTISRYLGNVGKAGIFGGIAGAGEGDTFKDRFIGGAVGTGLGLGVGAAAPAVISGVRYAAQPITNQFRRFASSSPTAAFSNVDDIATAQIAATLERSGKTGQQVAREVTDANAAGQPYILAEGIGTEGQRRLAGIAKTPGAARQWIDEDLGARDLGRGLRTQEAVETGLGIPRGQTAEQAQAALTREAQAASRPFYQAADQVRPVWTPRMQEFFEYPEFSKALREGFHAERGRALANNQPFNPRDFAITQFNEAGDPIMSAVPNMRTIHLMKLGIDRMINKHRNPVTGRVDTNDPQVQTLSALQRAMLKEVDSLNPMYARARAEYAGPAQVRTNVERGRDIPMRGRPEDTIPRFEALSPSQQQGARIGIADRIAEQIAKGSETGPLPAYLRSPKGRAELEAMSLHQGPRQPVSRNEMARASDPQRFQPDPIRRAIEREATMRQTFTMARGGSQTAENAADMLDTALPPAADIVGIGSNLLSGNLIGAVKAAVPAGGRLARGETEAQRNAMARMLMERDPAEMAAILQRIADLRRRREAAATGRAGAASGAAADSDINRRLQRVYVNAP